MPAKLPQALDLQSPNGATGSGSAVGFDSLDRALQHAGQQVARFDEARKAADDELAGRELETLRNEYTAAATERAALYDGRDTTFAAGELADIDARLTALSTREGLDDGVRASIVRRGTALRTALGGQAMATQAQARGQRLAADRDAAEQAQATRTLMAFNEMFDGLEDAAEKDWDGVSPRSDDRVANFNLAREQALAGLSEPVRDRVEASLLSREVTVRALSMQQDDEARDAQTLTTVTQAVTALENRAARDPSILTRWEEEFAAVRPLLPAHLRAEAEREAKERVFSRGLQGRIESGAFDAVKTEIENGDYDWMSGDSLQKLRERVDAQDAIKTEQDAQEQADIQAAMAADMRNILKGAPPDETLIARARALGNPHLGDTNADLVTDIRNSQQAAARLQPFMARIRSMSPEAAEAELKRLQEADGDAVGQQVFAIAAEALQIDQTMRAEDPARWTVTQNGSADWVAERVGGSWRAYLSQPSAETAQRYANETLGTQAAAGIPEARRRILQVGVAREWVASIEANGDPAAAMVALSRNLDQWGPRRSQVVRELGAARLRPEDLGALSHYADRPDQMAQYAATRGQPMNQLVPESDRRTRIDDALTRELRSYMAAFGSIEGGDATRAAARRVAYGMVSRGASVEDAVAAATAPMTEDWDFQGTWALPANQNLDGGRMRRGAQSVVLGLIDDGGRGLATPPNSDFTPAQNLRTYRDAVRTSSIWRNLTDGSGVELVVPAASGGWIRVRDASGRDVTRTWRQLEQTRETGPRGTFGFN